MKRTSIVIDLGFGDSGKGLVTGSLACQDPDKSIVIRFGGGHQCGHTVVRKDGTRHVFSNFGSGTMFGVPTYISHYCTVDPFGMMTEYNILKEKGIIPKVYIDPEAMIVTPWDIQYNRTFETADGTCGIGFGVTIKRNNGHYHLYSRDLLYPSIFKIKTNLVKKYFNADKDYNYWEAAVEWMQYCDDVIIGKPFISDYGHVILEGHQGIMLDQHYGFFPHVTHSNTTIKNYEYWFLRGSLDVYYVTRAYQTRHGNGPMTTENIQTVMLKNNENETNKKHKYQGEFRKGILDFDLLRYAINCNQVLDQFLDSKYLVMTCCDQIDGDWYYLTRGAVRRRRKVCKRVIKKETKLNVAALSYSPVSEDLELKI